MEIDGVGLSLLIFLGFMTGMFGYMIIVEVVLTPDLGVSQETADDICKQLTGNKSAVANTRYNEDYCTSWKGECKLICETPSYDQTQHIIIRSNSEK